MTPAALAPICPCCGYNLEADAPIDIDRWHIDPRGFAWHDGRVVVRRPSWVNILHTLATNGDRAVSHEVLQNRYSGSEKDNTLTVAISQLRRDLKVLGVPDPIGTVRGRGYCWVRRT